MDESNFGSLTSRLLARKGGATPAQRSGMGSQSLARDEDYAVSAQQFDAEIVPIARRSESEPVHRQQERIEASYASVPSRPRRSALDRGAKAAFTLRLDAERHLRLRLACTAANRSAQQVVTDALDRYLSERPELDGLAEQLRRKPGA